jgi:hypothetical protein
MRHVGAAMAEVHRAGILVRFRLAGSELRNTKRRAQLKRVGRAADLAHVERFCELAASRKEHRCHIPHDCTSSAKQAVPLRLLLAQIRYGAIFPTYLCQYLEKVLVFDLHLAVQCCLEVISDECHTSYIGISVRSESSVLSVSRIRLKIVDHGY